MKSTHDALEELLLAVRPEDVDKPWQEQRTRVIDVRVAQRGVDLYRADFHDYRGTSARRLRGSTETGWRQPSLQAARRAMPSFPGPSECARRTPIRMWSFRSRGEMELLLVAEPLA